MRKRNLVSVSYDYVVEVVSSIVFDVSFRDLEYGFKFLEDGLVVRKVDVGSCGIEDELFNSICSIIFGFLVCI